MKLTQLLNNVKTVKVIGNPESLEILDITFDSREVSEGTLFFAVKGFETDGHHYIKDVIKNGSSVIVLDNEEFVKSYDDKKIVYILVENSRKSLAEFSHIFFGKPSTKINLIGITGTKGKTTTSYYLRSIFTEAGVKSGLIGTNANIIDQKKIETHLTTPQSHKINKLFTEMVEADCQWCVMEVSSHALALNRVDFLDFDCALFTNLTSDHMDFHKDKADYLSAKKVLFDNLKKEGSSLVNSDDSSSQQIIADTQSSVYNYGTGSADFQLNNILYDFNGTTFNINYQNKTYDLSTSLVGRFNAFNASAAFAVATIMGFEINDIINGIKNTDQIAGRFEIIKKENKRIIIDFSHTSDSLKQTLEAINDIADKSDPRPEILTVFGCGGDKDKTKRPIMGHHAVTLSDKVIVTSDNPRGEDPYNIIEDILKGIDSENYKVIEDREEAIKTAIEEAGDNAVILLAGKGHEETQEVKGVETFFSDKIMAKKYLELCRN